MRTKPGYVTIFATLALSASVMAQEPLRAPTLQERVAKLETSVAVIETQFGVQATLPANLGTGETGLALAGRVDARERAQERVAPPVQRKRNATRPPPNKPPATPPCAPAKAPGGCAPASARHEIAHASL